jgi:hypothetical protein
MSENKQLVVELERIGADAKLTIDGDPISLALDMAIFLGGRTEPARAVIQPARAVIQQHKSGEGRRVTQHRMRLTNLRITADIEHMESVDVGAYKEGPSHHRVDRARRWLELDEAVTSEGALKAKLSALKVTPEELVVLTVSRNETMETVRELARQARLIIGEYRFVVVTEDVKFATVKVDLSTARAAVPAREVGPCSCGRGYDDDGDGDCAGCASVDAVREALEGFVGYSLDDFRQAHLDYVEGIRDEAPAMVGLSDKDQRVARRWLRSLEAARRIGERVKLDLGE